MSSLLLKDYYILLKQSKIFLFMIIVFAIVPNISMVGFAVIYSAMMPMTALAYDERAKWDTLAAMMPYSVRSIVLSKYILGYVVIFATTVLSAAAKLVLAAVQQTQADPAELLSIFFVALAATVLVAVQLPLLFRFGVEKGRLISMAFIVLTISCTFFGINVANELSELTANIALIAAIATAVTVVLNVASVFLAQALYKHRKF